MVRRTASRRNIIPAGTVLRLTRSGEMVTRAPGPVEFAPGAEILDAHSRRIGEVSTVVGLRSSPYVIVRPGKGVDMRRFVGTSVYLVRG